ncbi:electron transfer flavoprotein subunit beta [Halomonas sp. V046]|uniref:electron transfer flavoprotein subunit beta n=1 Tax=Halomonas sp. V046 TaxID=3459611 RepID=UPI0040445F3B
MSLERTRGPGEAGSRSAGARLEIGVLVSVGRHGVTERARRADLDARALEMALAQRSQRGVGEVDIAACHVGASSDETDAALRDYLGMGLERLSLLEAREDVDALPVLLDHLRGNEAGGDKAAGPRLVLCGTRAEQGEGSGVLPFALAEALGWTMVSGVAAIEALEPGEGGWQATVLQALPRGQRRRLRVALPAVIAVDSAAPTPRQSAFGPARRGHIDRRPAGGEARVDEAVTEWPLTAAKVRPKRLKIVTATSARDRFKAAAAKAQGGTGKVLTDVTPEQGAEAILALLREEGVLR